MSNPFCEHNAASATPAELRVLAHEILRSIEAHPEFIPTMAHVQHIHPGPSCREGSQLCDPESHIACYPAPDGIGFICIHAVEVPMTGKTMDVVDKVIASMPVP